jgi:hypothetical protein
MRNVGHIFDPDFRLSQDMDLLNEQRSLIHSGKLLLQPKVGSDEYFVLLFDNYCKPLAVEFGMYLMIVTVVLTLSKQKDGVTKYHVAYRVCLTRLHH